MTARARRGRARVSEACRQPGFPGRTTSTAPPPAAPRLPRPAPPTPAPLPPPPSHAPRARVSAAAGVPDLARRPGRNSMLLAADVAASTPRAAVDPWTQALRFSRRHACPCHACGTAPRSVRRLQVQAARTTQEVSTSGELSRPLQTLLSLTPAWLTSFLHLQGDGRHCPSKAMEGTALVLDSKSVECSVEDSSQVVRV